MNIFKYLFSPIPATPQPYPFLNRQAREHINESPLRGIGPQLIGFVSSAQNMIRTRRGDSNLVLFGRAVYREYPEFLFIEILLYQSAAYIKNDTKCVSYCFINLRTGDIHFSYIPKKNTRSKIHTYIEAIPKLRTNENSHHMAACGSIMSSDFGLSALNENGAILKVRPGAKTFEEFGWIYIVTNKGMPGLLKVGFTMRSPDIRAKELSHTGVPHPYRVAFSLRVTDPYEVEQAIHRKLGLFREGKEWFRCGTDQAIEEIHALLFNRLPIAKKKWSYNTKTSILRNEITRMEYGRGKYRRVEAAIKGFEITGSKDTWANDLEVTFYEK